MILVTCTMCGVVFDLQMAKRCGNQSGIAGIEGPHTGTENCYVCPLGHAGHDSKAWWTAKRRPASELEKRAGLDFMLPDFDVPGGVKP